MGKYVKYFFFVDVTCDFVTDIEGENIGQDGCMVDKDVLRKHVIHSIMTCGYNSRILSFIQNCYN